MGKKKVAVHEATLKSGADCRCGGYQGIVSPWVALCSLDNWGDDAMTPDGRPDGDTGRHENEFVPPDDMVAADIFGDPMDDEFVHDGHEGEDEDFFLLAAAEAEEAAENLRREKEEQFLNFCAEREEAPRPLVEIDETAADSQDFHPAEDLPLWAKNSHKIVGGGFKSNKDRRNWTGSCGRRGDDRYKSRRLGLTPISRKKVLRVVHSGPPIDLSRRRLPVVAY